MGSERGEGEGESTGSGSGGDADDKDTMTEEFFDPYSGDVSYGEVFAAYYAKYLAAKEAGTVDEALQQIADRYFTALEKS